MSATPLSKIAEMYGRNAQVSRINGYNIVHLDDPTDEQIKERIKEVINGHIDDDLEDDCPLCQSMKGQSCDIVYFKQD